MARPDRHAFVHIDGPLEGEAGAWQTAGRPFVVAASHPADDPETVRLGLATPDKRRVGLHLPTSRIARVQPPPLVAEIRHAPWQPLLDHIAGITGIETRAYGSLAWQVLTGLPYLHAASDIDLLVADRGDMAGGIAALLALPQAPRIDGEALLPHGRATALREYSAPRRLIKGHGGPWLEAA